MIQNWKRIRSAYRGMTRVSDKPLEGEPKMRVLDHFPRLKRGERLLKGQNGVWLTSTYATRDRSRIRYRVLLKGPIAGKTGYKSLYFSCDDDSARTIYHAWLGKIKARSPWLDREICEEDAELRSLLMF